MQKLSESQRTNFLAVLLLSSFCLFYLLRSVAVLTPNFASSSVLLKLGDDFSTSGAQVVSDVPDSEMLQKFPGLSPGFKNVALGLSAKTNIVGSQIQKHSAEREDGVTNTYELSDVTVKTSYSRAKNLSLDSSSEATNVKQLITVINHSATDKVMTVRSKSHISASTVSWNGKEYALTATPQSFKATQKTAPITTYAKDLGTGDMKGIEAFKDYTHTYYLGNSLSFAGDNGVATYDWTDVQALDHEILAYLDKGNPVIELVLYNVAVPANSQVDLDPEYSLDSSANYTARFTGDLKIPELTNKKIVLGDVNGDAIPDLIVLATTSSAADTSMFIIFGGGITSGTKSLSTESSFNVRYDTSETSSYLYTTTGDINGDGLADLLLCGETSIWVIFSTLMDDVGTTTGNIKSLSTNTSYNIRYDDISTSLTNGRSSIKIGDVNGDGLKDFVVGSYSANSNFGYVFVIFSTLIDDVGNTTGNVKSVGTNTNYNIRYDGTAANDYLAANETLVIGDVDGDGFEDLIFGAYGADNNGSSSGSVWVIFSTLIDDVGVTTGNNKPLNVGANYNIRYDGQAAGYAITYQYGLRAGDVNGDGVADLIIGAQQLGKQKMWVVFSTLIDDVGATTGNNKSLNTATNYNIRYDNAGSFSQPNAITVADVNGDGFSDLIFGDSTCRILFSTLIDDVGATTGNIKDTTVGTSYNIKYDNGKFVVADLNRDGVSDLVMKSSFANNNGSGSGSAWIAFSTLLDDVGATTGNDWSVNNNTEYNLRIDGAVAGDGLGAASYKNNDGFQENYRIGDIDGDGHDDLLLGSQSADNNGANSGSLWLILSSLIDDVGTSTGNVITLDDPNNYYVRYDGDAQIKYLTTAFAIGDVNGDSLADLIIGSTGTSYSNTNSGSVFVIFGSDSPIVGDKNLSVEDDYNIRFDGGTNDYVSLYPSVSDLNGDGLGDLVLVSYLADNNGADSGSVWVIFSTLIDDVGVTTGNILPLTTSTNYNIRFDGGAAGDWLAKADDFSGDGGLAIGDANGDGQTDLILGSYRAANNGANSGSAYVVSSSILTSFGSSTGNDMPLSNASNYNIRYDGGVAGDILSASLISVADVNGDNNPDIILGSSSADYNGANSGSVWIIFSTLVDDVGNTTGNIKPLSTTTNYNIRYDGNAGDQFPYGGAGAGDVNGDGFTDLIVNASFASNVGTNSGSIWIMFSTLIDDVGNTTGNNKLLSTASSYNIRYDGTNGLRLGDAGEIAVGDINGDGVDDLVFGGPADVYVWVAFSTLIDDVGFTTGNVRSVATGAHYNLRYTTDTGTDFYLFAAWSTIGDFDGDGHGDLVLGGGGGSAWVMSSTIIDDVGVTTGNTYSLTDPANYSYRYNSAAIDGGFPNDVKLVSADINNSGRATLFIGSINSDIGGTDSGTLYAVDVPYTMSGTVYSDNGTTDIGAGKTVAVSVNGAAATTTADTDGSGVYTFIVGGAHAGDTITLYLEDETEDAATVLTYGTLDKTDLDLYQDYLIVRQDLGGVLTDTVLDTADGNGDSDITSIFTASPSQLTVADNKTLLVPTGLTFTPGNNISVGSAGTASNLELNGTLTLSGSETLTVYGTLDLSGTLTMGSGSLDIRNGLNQTAGAFTASSGTTSIANGFAPTGGTFAHNSGTLNLAGSTQALNLGARTLNNLIVDLAGANDDLTVTGTLSVDGDMTITNVDQLNTGTISILGDLTNSDSAVNGTAGIELVGTTTQTIDSSANPSGINLNLAVNKTSGNVVLASDLSLNASGQDLTLTQGTLDLAGHDLEVNDSFNVSSNSDLRLQGGESISTPTLASGSSVTYYGTSSATLPSTITAYKNLIIDEAGSSNATFTLPDVNVSVAEGLSITDGTLAFDNDKNLTVDDQGAASKAISIAADGSLQNNGTGDLVLAGDVTNLGSVIFNASGSEDTILVRSSDAGTQRSWQGAGNYSFTDVTASDQVANESSPAEIVTTSSTDGGNNLRWIFGAPDNCPSDPDKTEPGICGCGVSDQDTDGDGYLDCQEQSDGTNPYDSGSHTERLKTSFCSEWNGSFGEMWNILEFENSASVSRTIQCTLKDSSGVDQSVSEVTVTAGGQTDLLVHEMAGWEEGEYGQICARVVNGSAGQVDGRMVYYKPNTPLATSSSDIDFAFALPYQNGLTGSQFVLFNTYQPSLDSSDSDNVVANWIELLNLDEVARTGTLYYYGEDGTELDSETISLLPGAKQDFSAHRLGANLVGLVEWRPNNSSALFQMKNVRYFYDNSVMSDSFSGAFPLNGSRGSGELLVAPIDTTVGSSVLEVGNASGSTIVTTIKIYTTDGELVDTYAVPLNSYASEHIILDSILSNAQGVVTVDSNTVGSGIAAVMTYGRDDSLGINFLYGMKAKQAIGSVLHGSYNTFLEQGCRLLVLSTAAQTVQISVHRSDGTEILTASEQEIAENGLLNFDLCATDGVNNYGVVTVQSETANSIVADVVRMGAGDSYRFPTGLK